MAQAAQNTEKSQGIEYTVYTLDKASKDKNAWQRGQTITEMPMALSQAESLFESGQYQKVRIKQRYFDKKQNRNIETVLKVYEGRGQMNIGLIFLFAILCGGIAFGATYFIAGR